MGQKNESLTSGEVIMPKRDRAAIRDKAALGDRAALTYRAALRNHAALRDSARVRVCVCAGAGDGPSSHTPLIVPGPHA